MVVKTEVTVEEVEEVIDEAEEVQGKVREMCEARTVASSPCLLGTHRSCRSTST